MTCGHELSSSGRLHIGSDMTADEQRAAVVDFLVEHREVILMDTQSRFCGPCGGLQVKSVYRSPEAAKLGKMLDALS